jgi:hypothetical protein
LFLWLFLVNYLKKTIYYKIFYIQFLNLIHLLKYIFNSKNSIKYFAVTNLLIISSNNYIHYHWEFLREGMDSKNAHLICPGYLAKEPRKILFREGPYNNWGRIFDAGQQKIVAARMRIIPPSSSSFETKKKNQGCQQNLKISGWKSVKFRLFP